MLAVVKDVHALWPDDMRLAYNGSTLSVTSNTRSRGDTTKISQKINVDLGEGYSANMLQLLVGLQGQQMSFAWSSVGRTKSSPVMVEAHAVQWHLKMSFGQSDVTYMLGSSSTVEKYERSDHAAHLFVLSMCNTQVVKEKRDSGSGTEGASASASSSSSSSPRLFTFVCSKSTLQEKLKRLESLRMTTSMKKNKKKKQSGSGSGGMLLLDLWWRTLTGGLNATEEFAKRVLLRTILLGAMSKVVELLLLVNTVAMSAYFFNRCFLRPPMVGRNEITRRVSSLFCVVCVVYVVCVVCLSFFFSVEILKKKTDIFQNESLLTSLFSPSSFAVEPGSIPSRRFIHCIPISFSWTNYFYH